MRCWEEDTLDIDDAAHLLCDCVRTLSLRELLEFADVGQDMGDSQSNIFIDNSAPVARSWSSLCCLQCGMGNCAYTNIHGYFSTGNCNLALLLVCSLVAQVLE